MEVQIRNEQSLPVDSRRLTRTAELVLRSEGCGEGCELSVLLVDDSAIGEMNRNYLGKDGATDVLSFCLNEPGEEAGNLLGDVVVSVETAVRQAAERGSSLDDEMDVLIGHGILHLLGYTDYTEKDALGMAGRLEEILGWPIG